MPRDIHGTLLLRIKDQARAKPWCSEVALQKTVDLDFKIQGSLMTELIDLIMQT